MWVKVNKGRRRKRRSAIGRYSLEVMIASHSKAAATNFIKFLPKHFGKLMV
jgi:hypothetical protein